MKLQEKTHVPGPLPSLMGRRTAEEFRAWMTRWQINQLERAKKPAEALEMQNHAQRMGIL